MAGASTSDGFRCWRRCAAAPLPHSFHTGQADALLPSARVADRRRALPGLTSGEGVLDTTYADHAPVRPWISGAAIITVGSTGTRSGGPEGVHPLWRQALTSENAEFGVAYRSRPINASALHARRTCAWTFNARAS